MSFLLLLYLNVIKLTANIISEQADKALLCWPSQFTLIEPHIALYCVVTYMYRIWAGDT